MSHFTVTVITPNGTDEELRRILQPFHEYECTGNNDQYVVNVDLTEEARHDFESATKTTYTKGDELAEYGDDRLYRPATPEERKEIGPFLGGSGYAHGLIYRSRGFGPDARAEVYDPEGLGWTRHDDPETDFLAWVCRYYGYDACTLEPTDGYGSVVIDQERNEIRVVKRTNPNAKWDWWQVGGRWSGLLIDRAGRSCNSCRKSDLDVEFMQARAEARARADWSAVCRLLNDGKPLEFEYRWQDLLARRDAGEITTEKARELYGEQAVMVRRREVEKQLRNRTESCTPEEKRGHDIIAWSEIEEFALSLDEYVVRARKQAGETFAFLDAHGWHERGRMLMFACVADEKDENAWAGEFADLIDRVPDDHYVTIVDCHI